MTLLPKVPQLTLALALGLVAGCAEEGAFPSLAPRPVEQLSMDEPIRPQPVVASDPALAARIAELTALAREGEAKFAAERGGAEAAVARAGAPVTDSWIEAQQAVSRLEGARAETAAALAQLDSLTVERAGRPTNARDFQALVEAVEAVQALADRQKAELDRLQGALRPI